MHEEMINRWNSKVKKEDVTYILGDFCFGKPKKANEILAQLNGQKILVKGNHDHSVTKWHCDLATDPFEFSLEVPFYDGLLYFPVTLSHYPYTPLAPDEDTRFLDRRPAEDGNWLLHGHVHCLWKVKDKRKMINVGVDVWDFYPVSYDDILKVIRDL